MCLTCKHVQKPGLALTIYGRAPANQAACARRRANGSRQPSQKRVGLTASAHLSCRSERERERDGEQLFRGRVGGDQGTIQSSEDWALVETRIMPIVVRTDLVLVCSVTMARG